MPDVNQSIASRWTEPLVKGGWTPVSTFFLDNYHRLNPKVSSLEAMLIIQLVRHKWDERNPRPTFSTLAKRMGVSPTAVRNHARSLEKKGYLQRIANQGTANNFDMSALFHKLEQIQASDKAIKLPVREETVDADMPF